MLVLSGEKSRIMCTFLHVCEAVYCAIFSPFVVQKSYSSR
jgi:hypothetical protein